MSIGIEHGKATAENGQLILYLLISVMVNLDNHHSLMDDTQKGTEI